MTLVATPVVRDVAVGTPIVLVDGVDVLYHLPAARARTGRRLERVLEQGFPNEWDARCGLRGKVLLYGVIFSDRRLCGVCNARAPKSLPRAEDVAAGGDSGRAGRRRQWSRSKLTPAHLRALHVVYERDGVGVTRLGELVWQRLGYANAAVCASAIRLGFLALDLPIRSHADAQRAWARAVRRGGFGGRGYDRRLSVETVERLWHLYEAGYSAREIARRFHARLGYATADKLRAAIEYAWKRQGHRQRSNREAELLSRVRSPRRCQAMTTGADGCRPHPCPQRPLTGSDFCLNHDPDHAEEVRQRAAALRARKPNVPKVPWTLVRPHLQPLLEPRPDRFGRKLERASGALARNTGIDPSICSRLLKGRHDEITVARANQLLAPLELTVEDLLPQRLAA